MTFHWTPHQRQFRRVLWLVSAMETASFWHWRGIQWKTWCNVDVHKQFEILHPNPWSDESAEKLVNELSSHHVSLHLHRKIAQITHTHTHTHPHVCTCTHTYTHRHTHTHSLHKTQTWQNPDWSLNCDQSLTICPILSLVNKDVCPTQSLCH